MAIPEDIFDLSELPSLLEIEALDDLFSSEPKPIVAKKILESPMVVDNASETENVAVDSFEEVRLHERKGVALEVVGADNARVGGIYKTSKLYAYEDFHSFLAREGGIDRERLSRLVEDVSPMPREDFVAFLARSNGIKDEQMVNRLRQALQLEHVIELKPGKSDRPVKMQMDLKVREGEDAASFFARAGSWDSVSSISEELAGVGLDELPEENEESFFRRAESMDDTDDDGEDVNGPPDDASVVLITSKQEVDVLGNQIQNRVSGTTDSIQTIPISQVVVKKRKSSNE